MPPNPPTGLASPALAAIEALDDKEKKSLRRFAYWRMLPISGTVHHSDDNDLYNEAIARTLDGRREWNSAEKTMFQHPLGCISARKHLAPRVDFSLTGADLISFMRSLMALRCSTSRFSSLIRVSRICMLPMQAISTNFSPARVPNALLTSMH